MIVVSNSSPLISLGAIGRLGLLHDLFGEISVPLAVLQEVRSVELRDKAGFRISTELYQRALREAGEAE